MIVNFYSLSCPITKEIRYVGLTIKSLKRRHSQHLDEAKNKRRKPSRKNCWINSLLKNNLKPEISLLFSMNDKESHEIGKMISIPKASKIEQLLIQSYLKAGCALTNSSKSLQPLLLAKSSQEINKRISEAKIKSSGKSIIILDLSQKFIAQTKTIDEAHEISGVKTGNIISIAKDVRKAKKFIFVYSEEYNPKTDYSYKIYKQKVAYCRHRIDSAIKANTKLVYQILPDNSIIKYTSAKEASEKLKINYKYICELAAGTRTSNNYNFTYTEPPV